MKGGDRQNFKKPASIKESSNSRSNFNDNSNAAFRKNSKESELVMSLVNPQNTNNFANLKPKKLPLLGKYIDESFNSKAQTTDTKYVSIMGEVVGTGSNPIPDASVSYAKAATFLPVAMNRQRQEALGESSNSFAKAIVALPTAANRQKQEFCEDAYDAFDPELGALGESEVKKIRKNKKFEGSKPKKGRNKAEKNSPKKPRAKNNKKNTEAAEELSEIEEKEKVVEVPKKKRVRKSKKNADDGEKFSDVEAKAMEEEPVEKNDKVKLLRAEYNPFESLLNGPIIPKYKRKFFDKAGLNYQYADVNYWSRSQFEWDEQINDLNSTVFGNSGYRANQRGIINATKCKRDVFVCMPTGGGKSLTFQLPAITERGVTLVIMPLLSLIVDQVTQLLNKGINVRDYSGSKTENISKWEMLQDVLNPNGPKMIFLTPEKISKSGKTMDFLTQLYQRQLLERVVIDEAHCVTQWGRDFREDYLRLGILKQSFPNVCTLALTATAPELVRKDVIDKLHMKNTIYFQSSFNRPNLMYQVREKNKDSIEDVVKFINAYYPRKTGIIYCCTISECDSVAQKLRNTYKLKAAAYHSKMDESERLEVQNRWMMDEILIMCATIAFGMGINKPDVRYVIHYSFPKSLTNYYQESGRAGRDGLLSHCIVYYRHGDKKAHDFLIKQNPNNIEGIWEVNSVIKFCEEKVSCRRVMQLSYLGEKFTKEQCQRKCDNCLNDFEYEERDYSNEALKIIKFLRENSNELVTVQQLALALVGNKSDMKINMESMSKIHGSLKGIKVDVVKQIMKEMLFQKLLHERVMEKFGFVSAYLTLGMNEALQSLQAGRTKLVLKIARKKMSAVVNQKAEEEEPNRKPVQKKEPKAKPEPKAQPEFQAKNKPPKKFENPSLEGKSIELQNSNLLNVMPQKPMLTKNELFQPSKAEPLKQASAELLEEKDWFKAFAYNKGPANKSGSAKKLVKDTTFMMVEEPKLQNISRELAQTHQPQQNLLIDFKQPESGKKMFSKEYGYCTPEQFEEILDRLKLIRKKIYNDSKTNSQILYDNLEYIFPMPGLHELCRKLPTSKEELTVDNIKNVGIKLLNQFGAHFIEEINHFIKMNRINKSDYVNYQEGKIDSHEPEDFDIREHLGEDEPEFIRQGADIFDFDFEEEDNEEDTGEGDAQHQNAKHLAPITKSLSLESSRDERWFEADRQMQRANTLGPVHEQNLDEFDDDEYMDIVDKMLQENNKENLELPHSKYTPSTDVSDFKRPRTTDKEDWFENSYQAKMLKPAF